jgi:hypothetical protein
MKGISLIVVIIALYAMHATATEELCAELQDRDTKKVSNKELCSKWGTLAPICKVIMSSEQSADYPLKCGAEGHICHFWILYVDDANADNAHTFRYQIEGPLECPQTPPGGEQGNRDVDLQNCVIDGSLGNFGLHTSLYNESSSTGYSFKQLRSNLKTTNHRRHLLTSGNSEGS